MAAAFLSLFDLKFCFLRQFSVELWIVSTNSTRDSTRHKMHQRYNIFHETKINKSSYSLPNLFWTTYSSDLTAFYFVKKKYNQTKFVKETLLRLWRAVNDVLFKNKYVLRADNNEKQDVWGTLISCLFIGGNTVYWRQHIAEKINTLVLRTVP